MKTSRLVNLAMLCLAITMVSCSGDDGERGPQGPKGDSIAGDPGADGSDGTNCWDLNGNGMNDTDEDINNDGNFDALDCQGSDGTNGDDGIACWDLNGNGTGDANEDVNNDGNFDALDCQGDNGTNGTDGNANVQAFYYDLTFFADYSSLKLDLFNIVDAPENYAYLFYIESNTGLRFAIPGSLKVNLQYTRVYMDVIAGELYIGFYNTADDTNAIIPGGTYTKVIVIAMELTNGAKNSDAPLADLKAAGVDTTDYNAVAAYLGLE